MRKMKMMALITCMGLASLMPMKSQAMTESSMGLCKITAYCPCRICSGDFKDTTATGRTARSGHTVAVDPDKIAYGTILKIGDHEYVAEDCGRHVKGDHIDIYFDSHEEVEEFGKKYKTVWIIGRNWRWPEGEE